MRELQNNIKRGVQFLIFCSHNETMFALSFCLQVFTVLAKCARFHDENDTRKVMFRIRPRFNLKLKTLRQMQLVQQPASPQAHADSSLV